MSYNIIYIYSLADSIYIYKYIHITFFYVFIYIYILLLILFFIIITEAVRKIKVFENVSNSDIEEPIKIYIAGATFRIKAKKTNELTDDNNEAI